MELCWWMGVCEIDEVIPMGLKAKTDVRLLYELSVVRSKATKHLAPKPLNNSIFNLIFLTQPFCVLFKFLLIFF